MSAKHQALTEEIGDITTAFQQLLEMSPKYANIEEHAGLSATLKRLKEAIKNHGVDEGLYVPQNVSAEASEAVLKNEMEPILDKAHQLAVRYDMTFLVHTKVNDLALHFQEIGAKAQNGSHEALIAIAQANGGDLEETMAAILVLAEQNGYHSEMFDRMTANLEGPEEETELNGQ